MITVFILMVGGVIFTFTIGGCMESDGNGEDAISDNPSDIIDTFRAPDTVYDNFETSGATIQPFTSSMAPFFQG